MWRLGGLNSGSSGLGLSPLHGHRVVFFKETLNLTLTVPLFNQVYKWVPANLMLGAIMRREEDARADKQVYMEDLTSQMEEAANREEQGQVYKITKLSRGSEYLGATDTPIVDKQGRLLTMEAEQEERWAEYFSEVLKQKYRFLILT